LEVQEAIEYTVDRLNMTKPLKPVDGIQLNEWQFAKEKKNVD